MSNKQKITEEQLKTIKDQQAKLQAAEALEATKKELEEEYGQVNIDLSDGSYTVVEKEEAPRGELEKA